MLISIYMYDIELINDRIFIRYELANIQLCF